MTQKINYTQILDNIGCKYGDVAIINGKEWTCWEHEIHRKARAYYFTRVDGSLYSDNYDFKPTAIWRRKYPDSLTTISLTTANNTSCDLTAWQRIWHESELTKPKRKITIEVDEGVEVLVNGKRVEV